ncbi:hypothetical protein DFJ77DRAFT_452751 [Powellomyces hirtus]|nr:hypothetical protein DFJ77DRAFT_452751 [Powellomyces hirtus]
MLGGSSFFDSSHFIFVLRGFIPTHTTRIQSNTKEIFSIHNRQSKVRRVLWTHAHYGTKRKIHVQKNVRKNVQERKECRQICSRTCVGPFGSLAVTGSDRVPDIAIRADQQHIRVTPHMGRFHAVLALHSGSGFRTVGWLGGGGRYVFVVGNNVGRGGLVRCGRWGGFGVGGRSRFGVRLKRRSWLGVGGWSGFGVGGRRSGFGVGGRRRSWFGVFRRGGFRVLWRGRLRVGRRLGVLWLRGLSRVLLRRVGRLRGHVARVIDSVGLALRLGGGFGVFVVIVFGCRRLGGFGVPPTVVDAGCDGTLVIGIVLTVRVVVIVSRCGLSGCRVIIFLILLLILRRRRRGRILHPLRFLPPTLLIPVTQWPRNCFLQAIHTAFPLLCPRPFLRFLVLAANKEQLAVAGPEVLLRVAGGRGGPGLAGGVEGGGGGALPAGVGKSERGGGEE